MGKDGTIYFSGNGLWALNPDFSLKFYYPDGGNCCGAIAVADDGTVIVGNGWLHAFDVNNLVFLDPANPDPVLAKVVAPKWIYNQMQADWSVAVSKDGSTVFATGGGASGNLIAIDPNNLTLAEDGKYYAATKWSLPIVNDRETMPVIDPNGIVYVADDQKILAVNPALVAPTDTVPPAAAVRTVLALPGKQAVRLALDATTLSGMTLVATVMPFSFNPDGSKLFYEDGDSELYAINPTAGSLRWSAPLAGAGENENPIIDKTGAIYVASRQNADGVDYQANVSMFTAAGVPVFTYSKGTTLVSEMRCPLIGQDGTLYLLIDGALVAFGGTADLSVGVVANPSPATTGAALTFTTTVSNAGPDKAFGATLKQTLPAGFFDPATYLPPAGCTVASSRTINCELGDLAAGAAASLTFTGVAQGTVGSESTTATVKSGSVDANQANNSKTLTTPVAAPVSCNLTVSAVGGPTSLTRGTTKYNFTATVRNTGSGSCAASTAGFYFSTDTALPTGDTLIGTSAIGALAAGASQNVTLSAAVSTSKIAAGSYYIGAVADYNGVIAETSDSDNTKATSTKTTVR